MGGCIAQGIGNFFVTLMLGQRTVVCQLFALLCCAHVARHQQQGALFSSQKKKSCFCLLSKRGRGIAGWAAAVGIFDSTPSTRAGNWHHDAPSQSSTPAQESEKTFLTCFENMEILKEGAALKLGTFCSSSCCRSRFF